MRAPGVVKRKPCRDTTVCLAPVGVALQVDVLVLERAPQPFDEHIVHPPAASIHRDAHAGSHQRAGEGGAGELAALVGVEDLWPTKARERLLQRREAE